MKPPQDLGAEGFVLGAMMLDPNAIAECSQIVATEDFYAMRHRDIYRAIMDRYAAGEPTDVVGIAGEQSDPLYVSQLVADVTTTSAAPHHARTVAESARRRRLIEVCSRISTACHDGEEIDAEGLIFEATRGRESREVTAAESVGMAMDALEASQRGVARGTPTGYGELDAILGGLQPGALYILAARPGVGKSAMATNIARNVAAPTCPTLFFSLEMSAYELGARLLASEGQVSFHRLRLGDAGVEEWQRISTAAETFVDLPLYIVDRGEVTPTTVLSRTRRLRNAGLVIVDYLQLMSPHVRAESRRLEIVAMTRALKILSKDCGVPVIVVSQLNRALEATEREPRMSDLLESGSIEQDADVVMFLHPRREETSDLLAPRKIKLIVAKHRNGPTGAVMLDFHSRYTRFEGAA